MDGYVLQRNTIYSHLRITNVNHWLRRHISQCSTLALGGGGRWGAYVTTFYHKETLTKVHPPNVNHPQTWHNIKIIWT